MTNERKLTLTREREKKADKGLDKLAGALAERRIAYIESATMAFCRNSDMTKNEDPEHFGKTAVAFAVAVANALLDEIYFKPMEAKDAKAGA